MALTNDRYSESRRYVHMTAAGNAINRSGQAKLLRVVVNDPTAVTLTLYDSNTASGAVIAVIDCNGPGTYEYGILLSVGLTADLSGTSDVTVIYQ